MSGYIVGPLEVRKKVRQGFNALHHHILLLQLIEPLRAHLGYIVSLYFLCHNLKVKSCKFSRLVGVGITILGHGRH